MEANGRLQGFENKGLWPECVVEAVAEDFKPLTASKRLKNRGPWSRLHSSKNKGLWPECVVEAAAEDDGWQTAGLNALRTEGHGGKRQAARL